MSRLAVILISLCCLAVFAVTDCAWDMPGEAHATQPAKVRTLLFNGGPRGGTFNHFANKMAAVISEDVPGLDVLARQSSGSVDNLLALCAGTADMAIANAGDAFLARTGKLNCAHKKYADVQALAYLYGAPAQLVVRADSAIHTVLDLRGKVLAVGNPGSGAALSAERFFRHLKLWGRIRHRSVGYAEAAADFASGAVDGFWVLAGVPNTAVIEAAAGVPVRLLDLHQAATVSSFYQLYPFYSQATIPAGTYTGQDEPVQTFQDAALWCARTGLDSRIVYDSLKAVFSETRLEELRQAHGAARDMSLKTGIRSLSIPLHPGAVRFWDEHRVEIPPILMP
ncbi:TRAP transporter solute receptor, TAXI family [Pseudodesulfovibrio mercurii]|uniref:TRAP transporter solute receptor, TAXI family n=1 Tax=Pseudodesulfovibrio mercurii TaxID=641491 RepID=F0JGE2_9BACT|nr:TAXI family TRAP transporter solute-binding subunit [Pseudodesulfovibrio mercurii]EGB15059.1 TRAP transporter solute receptor, TAXI family [Pseudodesulfovibrio mercurii]